MEKSRWFSFILMAVMIAGSGGSVACSTVTAKRVKPDDYATPGIRYWLAAPYLLVRNPVLVSRQESLYVLDRNAGAPSEEWKLRPLTSATQRTSRTSLQSEKPGVGFVPATSVKLLSDVTLVAKKAGSSPPPADPSADKAGTGKSGGDAPGGDGGGATAKGPEKSDGPPASDAEAMSIVWLPDYCHQYALQQSNVLASSQLKADLADGWKLGGIDSTLDSTQLVGKILDVLGAVAGAKSGGGETKQGKGAEPQAGERYSVVKQVSSVYLLPGLYSLVQTSGPDPCVAPRTISFDTLKTGLSQEQIEWVPIAVE